MGAQRTDYTTTSDKGEGANAGGRLARSAGSCRIASAIFSMTLRLAVGRVMPGTPTLSPPCTSTSAKAKATIRARSSLLSVARLEANPIDGDRSGQIQTV